MRMKSSTDQDRDTAWDINVAGTRYSAAKRWNEGSD
jgi:hypothetical protein